MFTSWFIIGSRLQKSATAASRQIKLLQGFFLYMGLFSLLMFLPSLWLIFDPTDFPLAMALGYTYGHIFMFLAGMEIARIFYSVFPRFAKLDRLVVVLSWLVAIVATIVTQMTMVTGTRPTYDYLQHVTIFNASTPTGLLIAIFMVLAMAPTAIMFLVNAIKNVQNRTRSLLLCIGLILMITGGPLHDNAHTSVVYLVADLLTIVAVVVVTSGVLYRFEERLAAVRSLSAVSAAP